MNVTGRESESEDHLTRALYIYPEMVQKIHHRRSQNFDFPSAEWGVIQ